MFLVMWNLCQNQMCRHLEQLPRNCKSTIRNKMRRPLSYLPGQNLWIQNLHLKLCQKWSSCAQTSAPCSHTACHSLVKFKDAPHQSPWPLCALSLHRPLSLTLRSLLNTVQDGEAVQHCHTRERNAELLDISQGPGVENQFPFHRDLSMVPTVVSSTSTSFLPHPYWVTSTPLLSLLSFICQPIHLTFFT